MARPSILYIGTRYTRKTRYGLVSLSSGVQASKATLNGARLGGGCLKKYTSASAARDNTHLTNDVPWQFSLGMHQFRKALREYSKGVLVSRSNSSNSSSAVLNTDKVKVKSSVKKCTAVVQRSSGNETSMGGTVRKVAIPVLVANKTNYPCRVKPGRVSLLRNLPLFNPKYAAARRRGKRSSMVGLEKSKVIAKNPVKVADAYPKKLLVKTARGFVSVKNLETWTSSVVDILFEVFIRKGNTSRYWIKGNARMLSSRWKIAREYFYDDAFMACRRPIVRVLEMLSLPIQSKARVPEQLLKYPRPLTREEEEGFEYAYKVQSFDWGSSFVTTNYSGPKKVKEVYVRYGSNRYEKRRNWLADRVVKNVPERVKRKYKKAKVGGALHYLMRRGVAFGSEAVTRLLTREDRDYQSYENRNERTTSGFEVSHVEQFRMKSKRKERVFVESNSKVGQQKVKYSRKAYTFGVARKAHAQQLFRFYSK